MKRIHIAGAGGTAGVGMTRCLKNHGYYVQGHDSSKWGAEMMECHDEIDPDSTSIHFCDLVVPVPDTLVRKWAGSDICFLPGGGEVELCQDKAATAKVLGGLAPVTYWVRDTHGAGGAGAQMASEYLPGRNYSCELLYKDGSLLGYFMKERLAYDLKGSKEPTHQRGSSMVSVCIDDQSILTTCLRAVSMVSRRPHGVYAIDLKENAEGIPKITEINPGRFLTASYVFFYSTGYNLPLAMVKAYFDEPYVLGPYPTGTMVIRGVDQLPYVGKI